MPTVVAVITTSVDGYITGPHDGPAKGLGVGGEPLHQWVFGGSWRYGDTHRGTPTGVDAAYLEDATSTLGAVVAGRATYEAASHWGEQNPWGKPFFIVTHRPEEQPPGEHFIFVDGVAAAVARALEAADGQDVHVMGGAHVIRAALEQELVDELSIIIAPVILGAGKRLFDGFTATVELEHLGVRQSPFATFIEYRVKRPS